MNIRHINLVILLFSVSLVLAEEDRTIRSVDIENPAETCSEDSLKPFKCVIDTLNREGDPLVHSSYFLFDITGDRNPELWVKSGSCEADTELWVYSADNGNVSKILSDYGGHTDFFLKGDTIGSLTCNTGYGYVSIYRYDRGKIKAKTAEVSFWNEDGKAKAVKKIGRPIIKIWETSETDISFKPLK